MQYPEVWLKVFVCDISDMQHELPQQVIQLLEPERQKQLAKYIRHDDKLRCAAAGLLLRYVLQCLFGLSDAQSQTVTAENGKPYLKSGLVQFSLSHSGSLAAGAFSNCPVGLDVEMMRKIKAEIYRPCMTDDECRKLMLLPENQRDSAFFRLWTMKESFTKMTGLGLYDDFSRFSAVPLPRNEALIIRPKFSEKVFLFSEMLQENYWLSVCLDSEHCQPDIELSLLTISEIIERKEVKNVFGDQ